MGITLTVYLIVILVVTPLLSWRIAVSGAIRLTPREVVYRSGMTTSWGLALAGTAILWWEQSLTPRQLGLQGLAPLTGVAWSAGTLAALLLGMAVFTLLRRAAGREESPDLLHLIPRTRRERGLFCGLALTAGVTEEFVFRGIALTALVTLPGLDGPNGPWLAASLVAVAFGLGHGYQDVLGMLRAGTMGLVLATPLILTGSLLPGMVAHAAIDMVVLVWNVEPKNALPGERA